MPSIFILIWIVFFQSCNEPVNMVGIYVNTNYEYTPFEPEVPYVEDTLILKRDSNFHSDYFGDGKYSIIENAFTRQIRLIYKFEVGTGGFNAEISINDNGDPMIILNKDFNHYYRKIK